MCCALWRVGVVQEGAVRIEADLCKNAENGAVDNGRQRGALASFEDGSTEPNDYGSDFEGKGDRERGEETADGDIILVDTLTISRTLDFCDPSN